LCEKAVPPAAPVVNAEFEDDPAGGGHIGIGHIVPSDKVIKGAAKTVPVVDQNLVALSSSFKGDNTHLIIPVANGKKKTKK
jgi:hypothetical protein